MIDYIFHTAVASTVQVDAHPLCLSLFNKGINAALSLIEQLPTMFDASKFELPKDVLQLYSEVAEALKEVLILTQYSCDGVANNLLKQICLPTTLKTLYQCTEILVFECKFCLHYSAC